MTQPGQIFDYETWNAKLPELSGRYQSADPFPHIVLDDFLNPEVLDQVVEEFPAPNSDDWLQYKHVNSKKLGLTDRSVFPPTIGEVVDELNSERFVKFISDLTGIDGLFADPSLEGGGMHQSERGGFLNVHADFTVHTRHQNWPRRVNIIVYLNKDWPDEYGGHLELWSKDMKQRVQKVSPAFNRVVIFNTDKDSYHGLPDPIKCPPGGSRKSLALYYYTETAGPVEIQSTEYKSRPSDTAGRRVMIYIDKKLLRAYDFARRRLGVSDKFVSKIINAFSRTKKK